MVWSQSLWSFLFGRQIACIDYGIPFESIEKEAIAHEKRMRERNGVSAAGRCVAAAGELLSRLAHVTV